MEFITKKEERDRLDRAMQLLVSVQVGNGSGEVEDGLNGITDDLDEVIGKWYRDVG